MKKNRIFGLIVLILISLIFVSNLTLAQTTVCGADWQIQLNQFSLDSLFSVSFFDANNGLVVGQGGLIFRTTDGGSTWIQVSSSGHTTDLHDLSYLDSTHIVAVGTGGWTFNSINGGVTWTEVSNPNFGDFFGVAFRDSNFGVVVGTDNQNLKGIGITVDGGQEWLKEETLPQPTAGTLLDVSWAGNNKLFAVGKSGEVLVNNDFDNGGINPWQYIPKATLTLDGSQDLTGVSFVDANTGWIVGWNYYSLDGIILKTIDGGNSWTKQTFQNYKHFTQVRFKDANNGVIIGRNEQNLALILQTTNGGVTWVDVTGNIGNLINGVSYLGESPVIVGQPNFIAKKLVGKKFKIRSNNQDVSIIDASGNIQLTGSLFENSNPDTVTGKTFKTISCISDGWISQIIGTESIESISFIDTNYGMAASRTGKTYYTSDGGVNWVQKTPIASFGAASGVYPGIYMTNTLIAHLGGPDHIYKTVDGGQSWQTKWTAPTPIIDGRTYYSGSQYISSIVFDAVDGTRGIAVGYDLYSSSPAAFILYTGNGGETWSRAINYASLDEGSLYSVTFTKNSNSVAIAVGGNEHIFKTIDGGQNWYMVLGQSQSGQGYHLMSVAFPTASVGFAVGYYGGAPYNGFMLKTQDAGETWQILPIPFIMEWLYAVSFSDINNGIAVGQNGAIYTTTDSGLNWVAQTSGVSEHLNSVADTGTTKNIVGNSGTFLRLRTSTECHANSAFDSLGNLYLRGTLTQGASAITPTLDTKNFIIKANGENKLLIDKNGNLITKGCAIYSLPIVPLPPSEPTNLHSSWVIKLYNGATNHIMWSPSATGPVTKYLLEKKIDDGNWVQIYDSSDPVYGISDFEFYDSFYNTLYGYGNTYYYRVRAQNDIGIGPYSSILTEFLDCPTTCADLIGSYYTCGTVGLTTGFCPTVDCGTCSSPSSCSNTPYYTCVGGGGGGGGGDCPEGCGGSYQCSSDSECVSLFGNYAWCACQDCNGDWGTGSIYKCQYDTVQPGSLCFACGTLPCFSADTLVLLANGSYSSIQTIKVGDKIIAWNESANQKSTAFIQKVLIHKSNSNENLYTLNQVIFSSGDSFKVTSNHPIYVVGKGWVEVKDLKVGDTVYKSVNNDMQEVQVASIIKDYTQDSVVYNLQTTAHDYFANDILVHNKCLDATTLVDMPKSESSFNTQIKISDVKPGSFVLGLKDNSIVPVKVLNVYEKTWYGELEMFNILLEDGSKIKATSNHIFVTNVPEENTKITAAKLAVGNKIMTLNGWQKISDIKNYKIKNSKVYDIKTETGNYFAQGMLSLDS